jgi:hypothetical protein
MAELSLENRVTASAGLSLQLTTQDEARLFIISRHVADLIHLHQKPNAPATAAIKACHQNNRGRAAFIERK